MLWTYIESVNKNKEFLHDKNEKTCTFGFTLLFNTFLEVPVIIFFSSLFFTNFSHLHTIAFSYIKLA